MSPPVNPWLLSVAPMMDWTDRHCRYFHRLLSPNARLYSEMVTSPALIHGDRERLLGFDASEHPLALQLGGSDPAELAEAARIGAQFGYDEINLNVGCPSDRVQNGRFGACLMREPELVGDCIAAMKARVSVPVTVKCRIGVDDQDPEAALDALVAAVIKAGVDGVTVHARKAWLKGLSPRENRDVPPLDYGRVFRLKAARPGLDVSINGGIAGLDEAVGLLAPRDGVALDGVMLGRAAYQNPGLLLGVDQAVFGAPPPFDDAGDVLEAYIPYVETWLARGAPLHAMTRHVLGLFQGRPGARAFRRHLSTEGVKRGAGVEVLRAAIQLVRDAAARHHAPEAA